MRAGPAGRLARAAGSGECAPQNVPRAPPERTQQARRRPREHFRCIEPVEKHRFSSFAASPQKMRSIFCESVAKMQQPCPCAEGAPAQRHMFCLCARRVAFFREGKFFVSSDFRTPPRLPSGRASERKQNKENNSTCLWFLCLPLFRANNSGPRKLQRAKLEEIKEFSKKSGRRRQGQIAAVAKQARLTAILFSF